MSRPVMAYALLGGLGAGFAANTAVAQTASPKLSIEDKVRLALCVGELSTKLGADIEVVGKGADIVVVVPAPAPQVGKFDACVVRPDGSMTTIYGAPAAHRPACKVAESLAKCVADKLPKAGS